jgi:hypothetical protein
MQVKMPREGFLVAACFGALAIVIGASGIYSGLFFETKDYDSHFSYVPAVMALLIGIALIVLEFRSETPASKIDDWSSKFPHRVVGCGGRPSTLLDLYWPPTLTCISTLGAAHGGSYVTNRSNELRKLRRRAKRFR